MRQPSNKTDDPPESSIDLSISHNSPPLLIPESIGIPWHRRVIPGKVVLGKIALFILSLYLFILAISLMKDGAVGLLPLVKDILRVDSAVNALGFGWLMAYVIMSGSPVAATALTFFNSSLIDQFQTFAMITGSRLGASFIVLFIGFLYVLRGRDRSTSLGMGLLSLGVTATTYIPALFLGIIFLRSGILDGVQLSSGVVLQSIIDRIISPLTIRLSNILPPWLVFLVGLGIILLSFNLFDRCLPQVAIKESPLGWMSRLVYRPVVMFILGALVTLISMSVSVSLSILVPLSSRGFVRRENVIPYIMGAGITTFIDTMLAAVLLNNPPAFTVVFVEMFSVTIVSSLILLVFYSRYQHILLRFVVTTTATNRNLAIFMATILLIPLFLLFA
jgi:Na+/phosphate symporter